MSRTKSIYVTYINCEGPLLKIWGQIDKSSAGVIEELLVHFTSQFDSGFGSIHPSSLSVSQLVISKFIDGNYYRTRILSLEDLPKGKVYVHFTDYGNKAYVSHRDIRVTDSKELSTLASVADQATEFVLKGVLPKRGAWTPNSVEYIRHRLTYTHVKIFIDSNFQNNLLVQLFVNENDFASHLVELNICDAVTTISQYHVIHSFSKNQYNYPVGNYENIFKLPQLNQTAPNKVYISYVENGPFCFIVHLISQEEQLKHLTNQLRQVNLIHLSKLPSAGTPILTRFENDDLIYRAIVMSVNNLASTCEVYYIDFGNSEVVSLEDIFEIPPEFLLINVMGLRFSLAEINDEPAMSSVLAKEAFKEIVQDEQLDLIIAHEEHSKSMRKFCKLFLRGFDVQNLLMKTLNPLPRYKSISLPESDIPFEIRILLIDSVNNFFVQPMESVNLFDNLMEQIQNHSKFADNINPKEIYNSYPVMAFYDVDDLWYRAEILNTDQHQMTVRFVDYGNIEGTHLRNLKKISRELIDCLPSQAIRCRLRDISLENCEETLKKFELITLTTSFISMAVLNKNESPMIVELFSDETNVNNFLLDTKMDSLTKSNNNEFGTTEEKFSYKDIERSKQNQIYITPHRRNHHGSNTDRLQYNWREPNQTSPGLNTFVEERNAIIEVSNDSPIKNELENTTQNEVTFADKYTYVQPIPGETDITQAVFLENCDNFFVQFVKYEDEINDLMSKIDEYVLNINLNDNYEEFLIAGKPCLAKFEEDKRWYRGEIEKFDENGEYIIYFVDYGNSENVNQNEILPLPVKFSHLPAQAIHVKLAGSKPINGSSYEIQDLHKLQDEIEGKNLKTHFLSFESKVARGIYEVLIYEGDNTNAINLNFNANLTVLQSLERPQYLETILDQNLELDINISFFISPNRMYCQDKNLGHILEKIETKLNDQYFFSDKKFTNFLFKGQPVIARYLQDQKLYRAEVRELNDNKVLVLYVDYGNCEKISLSEVWPLYDKELLLIPKLAFRCSLFNIRPPTGIIKWANNLRKKDYFKNPAFKCIIKDDSSLVYKVDLYDSNGNNLAEQLVLKHLASYENLVSTSKVQNDSETDTKDVSETDTNIIPNNFTFRNLTQNFSPIPLYLLLGQILPVNISHINSETDFHIQLLPGVANELHNHILNYISDTKNLALFDKNDLIEGYLYLGTFDNKHWFRVILLSQTEGLIQLCDTGEISSLEKVQIAEIPEELANYPLQAIPASLHQYCSKSNPQIIDQINQTSDFLCLIKDLADNRLELILYRNDGEILNWLPAKESLNLHNEIFPLPILIQNTFVNIPHEVNEMNIYIQYTFHNDLIREINFKLEEKFQLSNLEKMTEISNKQNLTCLKLDGFWYRTRIITHQGNNYEIKCIDFGYDLTVKEDVLFILPKSLYYHELCILLESKLKNIDVDKSYKVCIDINSDGKWRGIFHQEDVNNEVKLDAISLNIGEKYLAVVSHVDSPSQFYIQLKDNLNALAQLQEEINTQIEMMTPWKEEENNTEIVAAFYEDAWYRAKILTECSLVHFIDYGNACELDNCKLKFLPENLANIPPCTMRCCLEDYTLDVEAIFSDNIIDAFSNYILECEEILCTLIEKSDIGLIVKIEHNNELIDKNFIENSTEELSSSEHGELINTPIPSNDNIECMNEEVFKAPISKEQPESNSLTEINENLRIYISYFESHLKIWVHLSENKEYIENLSQEISENIKPLNDNPQVGQICGAIYEENWDRCRILSIDTNLQSTDVVFIDYGNPATVHFDDLCELPNNIANDPGFANLLTLSMPKDLDKWPENFNTVFSNHYFENSCQEYLYSKETNSIFFPNGENLVHFLLNKCNAIPVEKQEEICNDEFQYEENHEDNFQGAESITEMSQDSIIKNDDHGLFKPITNNNDKQFEENLFEQNSDQTKEMKKVPLDNEENHEDNYHEAENESITEMSQDSIIKNDDLFKPITNNNDKQYEENHKDNFHEAENESITEISQDSIIKNDDHGMFKPTTNNNDKQFEENLFEQNSDQTKEMKKVPLDNEENHEDNYHEAENESIIEMSQDSIIKNDDHGMFKSITNNIDKQYEENHEDNYHEAENESIIEMSQDSIIKNDDHGLFKPITNNNDKQFEENLFEQNSDQTKEMKKVPLDNEENHEDNYHEAENESIIEMSQDSIIKNDDHGILAYEENEIKNRLEKIEYENESEYIDIKNNEMFDMECQMTNYDEYLEQENILIEKEKEDKKDSFETNNVIEIEKENINDKNDDKFDENLLKEKSNDITKESFENYNEKPNEDFQNEKMINNKELEQDKFPISIIDTYEPSSMELKSEKISSSVIKEIPKEDFFKGNMPNEKQPSKNLDLEVAQIMSRRYDNSEKIVPGALTYASLNVSPYQQDSEISERRPSSLPIPTPSPRRKLSYSSEFEPYFGTPKPAPRRSLQKTAP